MSLPFGLLGLLSYQESTGYDLAKKFEDSLNNFWHAQRSQIYRELDRLETSGSVRSRQVVQDGRPNRRVYTITDSGRRELAEWLAQARPDFGNTHHEILLRVFFGAEDPEATLALLRQCRDLCDHELANGSADVRRNIERYADLIPDGQARSKYWAMTLELGIAKTRTIRDWAQRQIDILEQETVEPSAPKPDVATREARP